MSKCLLCEQVLQGGGMTRSFDLGLTMAGAISAGAYTGGVLDFLIQALDSYYEAKLTGDWAGLDHDINLRVFSGASAGAMTSAIAAIQLASDTEPVLDVNNPPAAEKNRLFDAWVEKIDIDPLLDDQDLRGERAAVRSVLDSTRLEQISLESLKTHVSTQRRPWVSDNLGLYLTVTNLRGVPHAFELYSDKASLYGMSKHKDVMRFTVSGGEAADDFIALDPSNAPNGNWPQLATAALASGAFPVGLRAQTLERDYRDYYGQPRLRDPAPAFGNQKQPYSFLCVDGGLMDNEPLELARRHLAQASGGQNPRDGHKANRAVVMIDPFPNLVEFDTDYHADDRLLRILQPIFGALVNQARFKPEELDLAEDDEIHSRYVISPSRYVGEQQVEPAIASAVLGGFGGFLHKSFRQHDFHLGRMNCQRFLERHFTLPASNPLFGDPGEATINEWCLKDKNDIPILGKEWAGERRRLPIIPLAGSAKLSIESIDPPSADQVDLKALEKRIAARIRRVANLLVDTDLQGIINGRLKRSMVKTFLLPNISRQLAGRANKWIASELKKLS